MKPVLQQTQDDCLRACVASIFELRLEDVPEFVRGADPCDWMERLVEFCGQFGLWPVLVNHLGDNSPRGFGISIFPENTLSLRRHCCVSEDGLLVWDPRGDRYMAPGSEPYSPDSLIFFAHMNPAQILI